MVLILYGNSLRGAHVRRNICYLTCTRHLITSRAVSQIGDFYPKRPIFLHACATCNELPSNISNMILELYWIHPVQTQGLADFDRERVSSISVQSDICKWVIWYLYKIVTIMENLSRLFSILTKASNRSNYRFHSTSAHLFLSYHLMIYR